MVQGFADIHNHQFAYLGFGGLAFHGEAYGEIHKALSWCDYVQDSFPPVPIHGPAGTLDFIGNMIKGIYSGNFAPGHHVGGHPAFDGWPRWDSVTHQSVYEDWLKRAVDGGLRLMVMLAVNNEFLCGKANRLPGRTCNDMEAVDLQLQAAKDMEAYVDSKSGGPGAGWYRIVRSPSEARATIEAGKLAVVLGIEVDYLFNCHNEGDLTAGQLRWQLDKYYALGVRHIFPIHFGNNGFGGTAFQNALEHATLADNPMALENRWGAISPLNPLATINAYDVATEDGTASGYEYRTGRRNVQGLTNLGKTLIEEMISRGMIIDVDHMSARSKADTLDICEAHHHPVVAGHVGFVEISHGGKSHEGQLLAAEVERIRSLGGMIGVIVHQGDLEEIDTWESAEQTVVPHTCGNSSNTVAQAYLYGVSKMRGGPVAWGTDFNGYAGLPSPRFGPEACQGGTMPGAPPLNAVNYPFTVASSGEQMDRCATGDRIFDINTDGLAHVGMLPDFIADLQAQGLTDADLAPLLSSADGYVTAWDKAFSNRPPIVALAVTVEPTKVPVGKETQFLVRAADALTGQPVAGTVLLNNHAVGATSTMLTALFEHRLERQFDPDTKKWTIEIVETIGEVQAPDYPNASIPFSFSALPPPEHLDVSVSPPNAVIGQPVAITVLAKDAATGQEVDGSVTINATVIGPTGVPLPYTFTDLNASGSVSAPGYPPARIPWTLEPHGALRVTVDPPKLPVGVPTQFVIRAVDDRSGQAVAGTVILDGSAIGATNMPLTATFTHNVTREFDPDIKKWTTTVTETTGIVNAPTYPMADIPLSF